MGLLVLVIALMTAMPLKSYSGPLQPLSPAEIEISANARKHVSALATTIGPRNTIQYKELQQASQYIEDAFKRLGFEVNPQEYEVDGRKVRNLVAKLPGALWPMKLLWWAPTMTPSSTVPERMTMLPEWLP